MALENRKKKKKNLISEHSEFRLYLRVGVRSDMFYSCKRLKKKFFLDFHLKHQNYSSQFTYDELIYKWAQYSSKPTHQQPILNPNIYMYDLFSTSFPVQVSHRKKTKTKKQPHTHSCHLTYTAEQSALWDVVEGNFSFIVHSANSSSHHALIKKQQVRSRPEAGREGAGR